MGIFGSGPKNKQKRDDLLRSPLTRNPFPGRPATATADNPPEKLLGRDKERSELKSYIVKTASTDDRPLIIIQGETGMGKSALTSYVFNEIISGQMDLEGMHAYAAFIEAYGEARDFRLNSFYSQIMKSLEKYGQLEKIVGRMVQFIGQTVQKENKAYFEQIFQSWNPHETLNSTIQRLNDPMQALGMVENVESILSIFLSAIRQHWRSIDTSFVKILLLSQSAVKERIKA